MTGIPVAGSRVAGIVAAAGLGSRLGGDGPKALRLLGDRPLFEWAVESITHVCDLVVLAAPAESV